MVVTVTLSNSGKQQARILKWFTPADGVDESLFTVTRDGQPVPYVGPQTKRPAATDSDYLVLAPGASVSNVVDLDEFYDFTETGRYEISYDVSAYDLFGKNDAASKPKDALASDRITLKAAGRAAKGKPQPPPPPPPRPNPDGNTFTACSAAQQTALNLARTDAKGLCRERSLLPGSEQAAGSVHNVVRLRDARSLRHRHLALHSHLRSDAGRGDHLRLQQQEERVRLRVPDRAVQDLPRQRLLVGAGHRHGLEGRHADPRDEPLRRRRRHR